MNATELMDFVKSLNNRGLLSKTIDEFDYEWVIWDYERSKVKIFSSNPSVSGMLPLDFVKWYSGMEESKILKAVERWKRESGNFR